jgi:hypothetical protein
VTTLGYVDRVTLRAAQVRPLRALLSVLAFPFWVLGAVGALLVVLFVWCWAAVAVGFVDVKERGGSRGVG